MISNIDNLSPPQEPRDSYSESVTTVRDNLSNAQAIPASEIIITLLESHSDYAGGTSIDIENYSPSGKEHIDVWLNEVAKLYNLSAIQRLEGRLVIFGLALLEPDLWQSLQTNKFLPQLIDEITKKYPDGAHALLSPTGKELWENYHSPNNNNQPFNAQISSEAQTNLSEEKRLDPPINHTDDPKTSPEEDLLGREDYGTALAKTLKSLPKKESFALHLCGPWGSGKSTLLNFIKADLEKDDNWLIVDFNAWRNQHIKPPWWSLLDAIFQKARTTKGKNGKKRVISRISALKEHTWRLTMGEKLKSAFMMVFIILIILMLLMSGELKTWRDILDHSVKILVAIGAIWVAFQSVVKSFFFQSSKAAESYLATTNDPMNSLVKHFEDLVKDIDPPDGSGKRVLIIVDDLDRCNEQYVVDLLEGFQIIFREAGVILIVAADQEWLSACFSQTYKNMVQQVKVPGKSLGSMFIEKIFQLNAPIPGITDAKKTEFWQQLLNQSSINEFKEELKEARKIAKENFKNIYSPDAIQDEINRDEDRTFIQQQAIRQESISRLSDQDIVSQQEHRLRPFAPFLESNPRSMIRLVNTYNVNQYLSVLNELNIPFKKLALWTILTMRWPLLGKHLSLYPEDISLITDNEEKNPIPDRIDEAIYPLFGDTQVVNVITGKVEASGIDMNAQLDEETVAACKVLTV